MRYAVIGRGPLALVLGGVVLLGIVVLSVLTIVGAVLGTIAGAFRRRSIEPESGTIRVRAELDPSLEVFPPEQRETSRLDHGSGQRSCFSDE